MTDYKAQVVMQPHSTDPGRDYITNVLNYSAPTTAPSALGDAIKTAFMNHHAVYGQAVNLWVKVYDRAAPLHSPPIYTAHNAGSGAGALGPRQVALCLSYYSGLNVRGQRGRIYVGPWLSTDMTEFPTSTILTAMIALATDLRHPGGADVIHQIVHQKTATWSNVSNYFVNNRWDTMRSRLPRETARQTLP